MAIEIDEKAIRPYADHYNDGVVQMSFTLPIPYALSARKAAIELAGKMGLHKPEVIHCQEITKGYTYFVVYGQCLHSIDYSLLKSDGFEVEYMSKEDVEDYIDTHIQRDVVVIGASTGTDTHSVGIDAMLNVKGFNGYHGMEAYKGFKCHNMGSQVPNRVLVAKAVDVGADAILVSQTVTQQKLHIHNLTQLVDIVEAEGLRKDIILICGGPRITHDLAKELGFDAGFSKGCYPNHAASFIVKELHDRMKDRIQTQEKLIRIWA